MHGLQLLHQNAQSRPKTHRAVVNGKELYLTCESDDHAEVVARNRVGEINSFELWRKVR
jgi:hypothetical protein